MNKVYSFSESIEFFNNAQIFDKVICVSNYGELICDNIKTAEIFFSIKDFKSLCYQYVINAYKLGADHTACGYEPDLDHPMIIEEIQKFFKNKTIIGED